MSSLFVVVQIFILNKKNDIEVIILFKNLISSLSQYSYIRSSIKYIYNNLLPQIILFILIYYLISNQFLKSKKFCGATPCPTGYSLYTISIPSSLSFGIEFLAQSTGTT